MKLSFEQVIYLLEEYKKEHGDLFVPQNYSTENGVKLGAIVNTIRSGSRKTTLAQRAKLDEIGFEWKGKIILSFDEVLELLKEYKEEYGDLVVPLKYFTADGISLGAIVSSIRMGNRKISPEEMKKLNELGFVWRCNFHLPFSAVVELLEEYKKEHGNLRIPVKYSTAKGIRLGRIASSIRMGTRQISADEKAKLNKLGFVWKRKRPFDEVLELLKEYKQEYGNLIVPRSYCSADGARLGSLVNTIRCNQRRTSPEERAKLDELGFVWKVR